MKRRTKGTRCGTIQQEGNELYARPVHELAYALRPARPREMLDDETSVGVRNLPTREVRRRETQLIEPRESVLERGRPRDHPMLRALQAAAPSQPRLEVHRQPFGQPRRRVRVREERRRAAEHALRE